MGALSISHWIIVVAAIVVIFGRGRISALMADIGGGFKNLRQGMRELEHDS